MSNHDLERRYRLLLAAYPWEHRRVYEDEMLAVLLAGAQPQQRRPSIPDVWNLLAGALRVRLNSTGRGLTQAAWADAAAVAGLLTVFALLTLSLHALAQYPHFPTASGLGWQREAVDWARLAGWGAVCAVIAAGWRWPAAGLAWIAVIAEAASLTLRYDNDPVSVVNTLWQFTLALIAAATLTIPAPRRRAFVLLGARRLSAILLAAAVVGTVFLSNQLNRPPDPEPGQVVTFYKLDIFSGLESTSSALIWLHLAGMVTAGLIGLFSVTSLPAPLRWRIGALFAPVISLMALINFTLDGWMTSNMYMDHAIYLQPAQWVALIGVPLVTLAIGALAVQRREHILTMVELGRAADRQHPKA
ncbi:hypothetical protein NCC78_04215 [Micromonospora phytophila]|uniref:hypothetical protein n=1 Tax=Micromonospora phytophila TaxID=709888 RepID=UPI00202E4414|nr:hypothetical protein [Micromonospora phytophila]MCM0673913.1 hypothetical protein [Micromonospora phytophila]